MKNLFNIVCILLASVVLGIAMVTPVLAQERSTPVTVQNAVDIDPANNTVKAQQSGTWNTTVSGSVSVSNTPNVSVTNTPNVNIANTPTVAISSTNNTVTTTSACSQLKPWATDTIIANGTTAYTASMNCGGFKEIRLVILASIPTNPQSVKVSIYFNSGSGSNTAIGSGNFATPSVSVTPNANYTTNSGVCYISHPVLSNSFMIGINNTSGNSITVSHISWAYLVN